ncbi:methyltransferase [Streptomyces luteolus]|uniref:Methyltransferase n=1 Tax=Streptomyces luteolus TaxID=3043615 RepID=A0ABT6SZ16_9ACTN|nr:methyltransferase [Streptomyces sp. B-S-A12]MDI3420620.1 methyltransferase [Streptomyces sp. B-S-A12]
MTHDDVRKPEGADRELIVQHVFGTMAAQTLRAATELRVVELIGDQGRSAAEVAAEAGTGHQGMTRLLRALAGLGILVEREPDVFAATPVGLLLDARRPDSLASMVRMFTDPVMYRAWEHLGDSVRTGDVAFDAVFGQDFFGHLKEHPELSAEFNAAMSQGTSGTAAVLPEAYDFGRFSTVADVGGGDGTLLAPVLAAHPELRGMLLDTAEGLAQAPGTLARHGVAERCALVVTDFFREVPAGADLYLIKSVLHDWSDDQAVTILRHIRSVLPYEGRVLVVEPVLPEVVEPQGQGRIYLSDLNMLVNVGGRERTRAEFAELCGRAGLSLTSVTALAPPNPFCLIEAEPV